MTPFKKILKSSQKLMFFWRKKFGKYFQLFSIIFSQIFLNFGKKQLILHGFSKLKKKKSPKMENLGPLNRVFFLPGLISRSAILSQFARIKFDSYIWIYMDVTKIIARINFLILVEFLAQVCKFVSVCKNYT